MIFPIRIALNESVNLGDMVSNKRRTVSDTISRAILQSIEALYSVVLISAILHSSFVLLAPICSAISASLTAASFTNSNPIVALSLKHNSFA